MDRRQDFIDFYFRSAKAGASGHAGISAGDKDVTPAGIVAPTAVATFRTPLARQLSISTENNMPFINIMDAHNNASNRLQDVSDSSDDESGVHEVLVRSESRIRLSQESRARSRSESRLSNALDDDELVDLFTKPRALSRAQQREEQVIAQVGFQRLSRRTSAFNGTGPEVEQAQAVAAAAAAAAGSNNAVSQSSATPLSPNVPRVKTPALTVATATSAAGSSLANSLTSPMRLAVATPRKSSFILTKERLNLLQTVTSTGPSISQMVASGSHSPAINDLSNPITPLTSYASPTATPVVHQTLNKPRTSFSQVLTPSSYSSRSQEFFHTLLNTSSSDIIASAKNKNKFLIHQPLTSLTAQTKIIHSIRFNGVDFNSMYKKDDSNATPTPGGGGMSSSHASAMGLANANSATFERLNSLLQSSSLNESEHSRINPSVASQLQLANHLTTPPPNNANSTFAMATAILSNQPASARTTPQSVTLNAAAPASARTTAETTALLSKLKSTTSSNMNFPPLLVQPDAISLIAKKSTQVKTVMRHPDDTRESESLTMLKKQNNAMIGNISTSTTAASVHAQLLHARKDHIVTELGLVLDGANMAAARKLLQATLAAPPISSPFEEKKEGLANMKSPRKGRLVSTAAPALLKPIANSTSISSTQKTKPSSAKVVPNPRQSTSTKTAASSMLSVSEEKQPGPAVSKGNNGQRVSKSSAATTSLSTTLNASVTSPSNTDSNSAAAPMSPIDTSKTTYSGTSTTRFATVFNPPPAELQRLDPLDESNPLLHVRSPIMQVSKIPAAEQAGSISFRRHPSEQGMYLRKLEGGFERSTNATLDAINRDGSLLTHAAMQSTALKRNLSEVHAVDAQRSVLNSLRAIEQASVEAAILAENNWREEKDAFLARYAQKEQQLAERLELISSKMQEKSKAAWEGLKERREEEERLDLNTYASEERSKELQQIANKVTLLHEAEQTRWSEEWENARRAKDVARLQSEQDSLVKAVEVEQFKSREYERKRLKARHGVLWVRVVRGEDLGEENLHYTYGMPLPSGANGDEVEADGSKKRSPTILPKSTSSCIAVQLRFKAASLANELVYTRFFGRDTSPTIGECFKIKVSNAYLQTLFLAVHATPIKQVEAWEREVRAALAMVTAEAHASQHGHHSTASSRRPSVSLANAPHGHLAELIKHGGIQVKHAVMKEPNDLTGSPSASPSNSPPSHRRRASFTSDHDPSHRPKGKVGPTTVLSDDVADSSLPPSGVIVEENENTDDEDQNSNIDEEDEESESRSEMDSNSEKEENEEDKGEDDEARTPPLRISVDSEFAKSQPGTAEASPNTANANSAMNSKAPSARHSPDGSRAASAMSLRPPSSMSRAGSRARSRAIGALQNMLPHSLSASASHLSVDTLGALASRLRSRQEVLGRVDEVGRVGIQLQSIRACPHGRMFKTFKLTKTLTEYEAKERELKRAQAKRSAQLAQAAAANRGSAFGSGPLSTTNGEKKKVGFGIGRNNNDGNEVIQCGSVTVELLLLPLFSLAAHERARARSHSLTIGESDLNEEEQIEIENELMKKAEDACQASTMPDMSWCDDPLHTVPSAATRELESAICTVDKIGRNASLTSKIKVYQPQVIIDEETRKQQMEALEWFNKRHSAASKPVEPNQKPVTAFSSMVAANDADHHKEPSDTVDP